MFHSSQEVVINLTHTLTFALYIQDTLSMMSDLGNQLRTHNINVEKDFVGDNGTDLKEKVRCFCFLSLTLFSHFVKCRVIDWTHANMFVLHLETGTSIHDV
jgi:hypothetical protein